MSETQNPGAPVTDELARNYARHQLADLIYAEDSGPEWSHEAEAYADTVLNNHTVTWERDVNAAGVSVRRYVLRGEWAVDLDAVTESGRYPHGNVTPLRPTGVPVFADRDPLDPDQAALRVHDEVIYRDRRDNGRRWTVQGFKYQGTFYTVMMTAPGLGEHSESQWADRGDLTLVRRKVREGETLPVEAMVSGVAYAMPTGGEYQVDDLPPEPDITDEILAAKREGYAEALREVYSAVADIPPSSMGEPARMAAGARISAIAWEAGVKL